MRKENNLYDFHSHLLYDVDDGAYDKKEMKLMLIASINSGVKNIILTPHYNPCYFVFDKKKIGKIYSILKEIIIEEDLSINVFLGMEIFYHQGIIDNLYNGLCKTIENTKYVLVEFFIGDSYLTIKSGLDNILRHGYIPVLAHIERYKALKSKTRCKELHKLGVVFQSNAYAILDKKICSRIYFYRLIKNNLLDVVGSDCHHINDRRSVMDKAYHYVSKHYGKKTADNIFIYNSKNILGKETEGEN